MSWKWGTLARSGRAGRGPELTCSINRLPYFSIRELSKRSDTLILLARTRRAPKLVFYIQSIQSLMLFVCDITGMPPMFTDAPNHIGFANFCLRTLFHFSVSSGRENIILDILGAQPEIRRPYLVFIESMHDTKIKLHSVLIIWK